MLECARLGYKSSGVELNRPLVVYSKIAAKRYGLSNRADFFRKNIFKTDLTSYNTAILFGAESMVSL